jgi:AcrR family transcriptional regulator
VSDRSAPTSPHRPGRLRERLREATADAILAAAEGVFAEEGLHAARMEQIAARAGVAVGTLYNHFEDKDALVRTLVVTRRRDLIERLDAALAGADALPFDAQLRRFLGAVFAHAAQHGALLAALVQAGEGPARPGYGVLKALHERADALMARGVAAGALRADRADVLGLAFVGIARVFFLRALHDRGGGVSEAEAASLVDLFLRGARA